MPKYYMGSTSGNNKKACKAKTLIGAKREATARFGSGYIDDATYIYDADGIKVAIKKNNNGSLWVRCN